MHGKNGALQFYQLKLLSYLQNICNEQGYKFPTRVCKYFTIQYIKLTQIIGNTFSELQQLLTSELKRQQQPDNQISIIELPNCIYNKPEPILPQPKILTQLNELIIRQNEQQKNQKPIQQLQQLQKNIQVENSKECDQNKNIIVQKSVENKNIKITKKRNIKIKKSLKLRKIKKPQPIKIQRKMKLKKKDYQQGKPYPPLNAFMLFLKQKKHDIMRQKPELSPSQVSIYASTVWKSFTDKQKEHYIQIYKKNHQLYVQELNKFEISKKQKTEKINKQNQKKQQNPDSPFEANSGKIEQLIGVKLRSRRRRKHGESQVICLESQEDQYITETKKSKN